MARIFVPKNISETGCLYTEETTGQIKQQLSDAKVDGNEFVKFTVSDIFNGYKRELTIKASLIQAYE